MPKLFISLPMRGLDEVTVHAEMDTIKKCMDDAYSTNFEIIDTYETDPLPEGTLHGCYYLGESIKKLASADICVFHPEWKTAPGCIIEHMICDLYDIPHAELQIAKNQETEE